MTRDPFAALTPDEIRSTAPRERVALVLKIDRERTKKSFREQRRGPSSWVNLRPATWTELVALDAVEARVLNSGISEVYHSSLTEADCELAIAAYRRAGATLKADLLQKTLSIADAARLWDMDVDTSDEDSERLAALEMAFFNAPPVDAAIAACMVSDPEAWAVAAFE